MKLKFPSLPFISPSKLRRLGVLGINGRNANFVLKYNKRNLYPLADSKLKCKDICQRAGIYTPLLYGVISSIAEIASLSELTASKPDFVIKPEHGAGGSGVLVLRREENAYYNSADRLIDGIELRNHLAGILSGLFSLGGKPDRVMLEYKVNSHSVLSEMSYRGVADMRIIVFLGVPIMAMLRLPTKRSNGRANLHQGALGVGVDLKSGTTKIGIQGSSFITVHPDNSSPITGVSIPYWQEMLSIASRCYDEFGLGYLGVDLVLDKDLGPLLLEINVRPGLSVQLANQAGLLTRLKIVEKEAKQLKDFKKRIAFGVQKFSPNQV